MLVVALAAGLAAPARAEAATPCWQQVLLDWRDGSFRSYPVSCYREALRRMPQDLAIYSTAPDDIRRALAARIVRRPAVARTPTPASAVAPGPEDSVWPELLLGGLGVLGLVLVPAGLALHRVRSRRV